MRVMKRRTKLVPVLFGICAGLVLAHLRVAHAASSDQGNGDSPQTSCPVAGVVATWDIHPKTISSQDAREFWHEFRKFRVQGASNARSIRVAENTSNNALGDLFRIVEDTAKAEVERFAVQVLRHSLCTADPGGAAPYFPNTCAINAALTQPVLTSIDPLTALRGPIESDIKYLPACVIYQRASSHFGYLVTNLL